MLVLDVGDIVVEGGLGNVERKVCRLLAGLLESGEQMLDLAGVTAKYVLVDWTNLISRIIY